MSLVQRPLHAARPCLFWAAVELGVQKRCRCCPAHTHAQRAAAPWTDRRHCCPAAPRTASTAAELNAKVRTQLQASSYTPPQQGASRAWQGKGCRGQQQAKRAPHVWLPTIWLASLQSTAPACAAACCRGSHSVNRQLSRAAPRPAATAPSSTCPEEGKGGLPRQDGMPCGVVPAERRDWASTERYA